MNRPKWTTVAIPEKSVAKVGDMVYVNVRDCHAPLESRAIAAALDRSLDVQRHVKPAATGLKDD